MKTIKLTLVTLVTSILFFLVSCSDDDINPNATIKLEVATTSGSTSVQSKLVVTNGLEFTSGSITFTEIVFDGQNGTVSVSRTHEQIATIDYATGIVTPEVIISVPPGNYTNVNLGIELQDENDTPTVVIDGTYTNSNDLIIPIRFEFNSGEVFEANAASVVIEERADLIGKITFDAISWFSTITASQLDNATLTDGVIVISGTSNAAIFDTVADRLDVDTEVVFQ